MRDGVDPVLLVSALRAPTGQLAPLIELIIRQAGAVHGQERRRVPQVDRHGRQYYVHSLVLKCLDDADEVVFVMAVNTRHAGVIVGDTAVREHLHAFPLELLHRIGRPDLQDQAVQRLPDPCALQCLDSPDQGNVLQEILIERARAVRTYNLVVPHQDDGKVGRVVRKRVRNRVNHVRVDRGHGRIDHLDVSRR